MLYILIFPDTYQAISFENTCKNAGFSFTLRPVPRMLSSSCGIAAQVDSSREHLDRILKQCQESGVKIESVYLHQKQNGQEAYSLVP